MEVIKHMKSYRRFGVLAVVCVAAETMFELVIPIIMADIIDVGVAQHNSAVIIRQGILMVGCALLSLVLGVMYSKFSATFANGTGYSLREAIFKKIQSFSFSNIDHFSSSSLITRLTSDVTIIANSISTGLRPLVRAPVMLLSALTLSFVINAQLAIVFLIAAPLLGLILFMIISRVRPLYRIMQDTIDKVNLTIQENLIAIRVVKAFVRQDYEIGKFDVVNTEFESNSERAFRLATLNMPAMQFIMYATIIAILWFGGNLIFVGSMKVGELTGFLSYVLQVLNALMMISNVFMLLSRALTSQQRIQEVLDESNDMDLSEINPDLELQDGSIVFDHVSFKYSKSAQENVLSDISFALDSGDTVGIIGTTGSSKSTLAQLILRLYDASQGSVIVSGHDVKEYSLEHLRDAIAIVLQKNTLFSGTISENLRWGDQFASDQELIDACKIANAHDFIMSKKDGYNAKVEQGGNNFSGGQKQRLCIARALLKKPRILIFDDSTSALDRATEANIWKQMQATLPQTTKIIIAQKISSVMDADQIIIMDNGRIDSVGNHESLLKFSEIYQEIFQSQQEGVL